MGQRIAPGSSLIQTLIYPVENSQGPSRDAILLGTSLVSGMLCLGAWFVLLKRNGCCCFALLKLYTEIFMVERVGVVLKKFSGDSGSAI